MKRRRDDDDAGVFPRRASTRIASDAASTTSRRDRAEPTRGWRDHTMYDAWNVPRPASRRPKLIGLPVAVSSPPPRTPTHSLPASSFHVHRQDLADIYIYIQLADQAACVADKFSTSGCRRLVSFTSVTSCSEVRARYRFSLYRSIYCID